MSFFDGAIYNFLFGESETTTQDDTNPDLAGYLFMKQFLVWTTIMFVIFWGVMCSIGRRNSRNAKKLE